MEIVVIVCFESKDFLRSIIIYYEPATWRPVYKNLEDSSSKCFSIVGTAVWDSMELLWRPVSDEQSKLIVSFFLSIMVRGQSILSV